MASIRKRFNRRELIDLVQKAGFTPLERRLTTDEMAAIRLEVADAVQEQHDGVFALTSAEGAEGRRPRGRAARTD
jgi:hypothetical protein